MPKSVCVRCGTEETLLWRTEDSGQVCYDCHGSREEPLPDKPEEGVAEMKTEIEHMEAEEGGEEREARTDKEEEVTPAKATGRGTRKSTRSTRYKTKTPMTTTKVLTARGRGRRSLMKRPPLKAPTATATVVTSDYIFYKGFYLQVGDIVSMVDVDGGVYYAQLRGFMTDQYCEKSAVVTWLLPTKASPPPERGFDPATYICGPEEELPRKLDVMQFVMHAPSDYYKCANAPYPVHDHSMPFIWTSMEPVITSMESDFVATEPVVASMKPDVASTEPVATSVDTIVISIEPFALEPDVDSKEPVVASMEAAVNDAPPVTTEQSLPLD